MNLDDLTVAVVGGGIGGLCAATALAQRGARVTVYEQAEALTEVGAGLQISANGQTVLTALGIVDGVPARATVIPGTQMRDGRSDRLITTIPAPSAGPTWGIHRADLLALLVQAAERAGVTLTLNARRPPGAVSADVIVAADGFQSTWRPGVEAPHSATFSGQVAWRAIVPWDGDAAAETQLAMGSGAHVVTYPLRDGTAMNLVAIEERRGWTKEGWRHAGDPDDLKSRFAQFRGRAGETLAAVESVHLWALHLRPVATTWQDGQVALLGDAAHPTLPFMAQGACLALEDAWALTASLSQADTVAEGLHLYQARRHARAERVVSLARGNAWRFHMPRPWAWGAQLVLRLGSRPLARRLDWLYGYDVTRAYPM